MVVFVKYMTNIHGCQVPCIPSSLNGCVPSFMSSIHSSNDVDITAYEEEDDQCELQMFLILTNIVTSSLYNDSFPIRPCTLKTNFLNLYKWRVVGITWFSMILQELLKLLSASIKVNCFHETWGWVGRNLRTSNLNLAASRGRSGISSRIILKYFCAGDGMINILPGLHLHGTSSCHLKESVHGIVQVDQSPG